MIVALVLLFLTVLVIRLVVSRQLSVNQGLIWVGLLAGCEALLLVPGLLLLLTKITGAVLPVSALTLLALTTLVILLLQVSVALSRLQERHRDLVHAVALMERRLRQTMSTMDGERAVSTSDEHE